MLLFSSRSPPLNVKKPCFIVLGVQSVSVQHFTCSGILWQETLVASGLVPLPVFLFRHPSKNVSLSLFPRESTPTLLACTGFPSILHSLPQCAFFSTTALHSSFYHQIFVVTLLTQIGRAGLRHTIDNYRKLPETEGFVTAAIITPKHGPLWDADRASYRLRFNDFSHDPAFLRTLPE